MRIQIKLDSGRRKLSKDPSASLPSFSKSFYTHGSTFFSNCLGDYGYNFQGSSELISITVTVSLFFLQNPVTGNNSPQEFSRLSDNYSYMI